MRHVDFCKSLHQSEPCDLIKGKHMTWDNAAIGQGDPNSFRLGDQITDGQNQSIRANHRAIAGTLRPKDFGRKRVFGNDRAKTDHGCQSLVEFKVIVLRIGRHNVSTSHPPFNRLPNSSLSPNPNLAMPGGRVIQCTAICRSQGRLRHL